MKGKTATESRRLVAVSEARALVREGRLRTLREQHGFSQLAIARALGVDASAVSRWEAGDRVPREQAAERLHVLLSALEKDVS
jgi:transcriptional regulator with XRE-family HTH domain